MANKNEHSVTRFMDNLFQAVFQNKTKLNNFLLLLFKLTRCTVSPLLPYKDEIHWRNEFLSHAEVHLLIASFFQSLLPWRQSTTKKAYMSFPGCFRIFLR